MMLSENQLENLHGSLPSLPEADWSLKQSETLVSTKFQRYLQYQWMVCVYSWAWCQACIPGILTVSLYLPFGPTSLFVWELQAHLRFEQAQPKRGWSLCEIMDQTGAGFYNPGQHKRLVSEWVTERVLCEDKTHSTGLTMSDPQIMVSNEP